MAVFLGACSSPGRNVAENAAACSALTKTLADQQQAFVDRVQSIRAQHLLLRDYDRQMIDAINARRSAIQATKLMELSVSDDVAGCSGKPLEDLRYRAQEEMQSLRSYLGDFNRALKSDPAGVYIDQP
ncbi:MAG TPA: hypothetical protein VMB03_08670 [Bryobacteraceae bacterium]|nr:hypothetical protein [Bryobacteraceae bacterium]